MPPLDEQVGTGADRRLGVGEPPLVAVQVGVEHRHHSRTQRLPPLPLPLGADGLADGGGVGVGAEGADPHERDAQARGWCRSRDDEVAGEGGEVGREVVDGGLDGAEATGRLVDTLGQLLRQLPLPRRDERDRDRRAGLELGLELGAEVQREIVDLARLGFDACPRGQRVREQQRHLVQQRIGVLEAGAERTAELATEPGALQEVLEVERQGRERPLFGPLQAELIAERGDCVARELEHLRLRIEGAGAVPRARVREQEPVQQPLLAVFECCAGDRAYGVRESLDAGADARVGVGGQSPPG